MMDALEVGRVTVAARRPWDRPARLERLRDSQERKAFGKPIARHQAIQFKLADMATRSRLPGLLTLKAARMKDAGQRSDLEAGWRSCSPPRPMRGRGGGLPHSRRLRLLEGVRDRAALPPRAALLIGKGTSEIQRMVIGKKLLERTRSRRPSSSAPPPRSRAATATRTPDQAGRREPPGRGSGAKQLKLVMRLELRAAATCRRLAGRGAPAAAITEGPGQAMPASTSRWPPLALQRAGGRGRRGDWVDVYDHGHVRVSGDPAVTKLIGNVIQRQLARA